MNKVSSPRQIKVAKRVLYLALPAFAVAIFLNASLALGFNASQSLPQTTFILLKFPKIIQRGSYVAFTPPKRFDRGFYFVKQVIGVEGDAVVRIGDEVCINNRCFAPTNEAPVFSAQIEMQIIPEGHYYVAGETDNSLDSRYAALGLIPKSAIMASGIATNWLPNIERLLAWFQGKTGTQRSADKKLEHIAFDLNRSVERTRLYKQTLPRSPTRHATLYKTQNALTSVSLMVGRQRVSVRKGT